MTRTETEMARKPQSSRERRDGKEKRRKWEPATRRASPCRDSATCASSDGAGVCPTAPPRLAVVRQTSAIGRARTENATIMIARRSSQTP